MARIKASTNQSKMVKPKAAPLDRDFRKNINRISNGGIRPTIQKSAKKRIAPARNSGGISAENAKIKAMIKNNKDAIKFTINTPFQ
jgi:hypothetical protein